MKAQDSAMCNTLNKAPKLPQNGSPTAPKYLKRSPPTQSRPHQSSAKQHPLPLSPIYYISWMEKPLVKLPVNAALGDVLLPHHRLDRGVIIYTYTSSHAPYRIHIPFV